MIHSVLQVVWYSFWSAKHLTSIRSEQLSQLKLIPFGKEGFLSSEYLGSRTEAAENSAVFFQNHTGAGNSICIRSYCIIRKDNDF